MADRVGKEVEKFAERVDEWHSHGNGSERDLYQTTLHMVDSLKEFADSTVEELRDQSGAENRGELQKSVRRRIKKMAEEARPDLDFQSVLTSTEPHAGPQSARVQELRHWEAEAATWDLLRIIIEHYHPEPGHDIEAEKRERLAAMGDTNRYSPNIEIWDRFLLEDDEAKEKEIVLRWLERTAQNSESDIKSITEQLEAESGKDTQTWTSGWLDTKFKLKQEKRLNHMDRHFGEAFHGLKANDEAQDLVTQLDPDAPTRQKRALAKSDEYYERALWMVCYEMLRRGVPWGEVSEWCKDKNEAWRGISLGAADETHPDGVPNLSGPTAGYLFRRMCYCAAIGSRTQYEAAVYGLLSGDVETVESVCRSWDDHLYARYNALLLSRFDEYLLKNYPRRLPQAIAQKFVFRDAAAKMDSWESSSAEVIDLLKSQRSTAALAELPIKLIQSSLIGGGMSKLVRKIGEALGLMLKKDTSITSLFWDPASDGVTSKSHSISSSQQSTGEKCYQTLAVDSNCLRILVHIFIVLRKGLGLLEEENEAERANLDNIIIAYIEFLRMTKRILLIPLYAAQLDGDRPYHCLARILPDIRNPEEQKEFIKLLEGYDLDPARVLAGNFAHIAETLTRENKHTYIPKYTLLEETKEPDDLWPGVRVRRQFAGLDINPSDDLILDSMRWHLHLEREIETTFPVLHTGLMYLLRKHVPSKPYSTELSLIFVCRNGPHRRCHGAD
jgi:nuclear pore complex protein Nup107